MNPVFLSDSVWLHFGTSSPTTGAATDADSTPTVVVAEDGTDMGYSPTVTNVATGLYKVQIAATAANGFEAGKRYSVYATATVDGITGRDGIAEFEVLAVDLSTALDAPVSTRLETAGYTAPLDAAGTRAAIGLASANMDTQLSALAALIGTRAAAGDAMTLTAGAVDAVWDEIIDGGYSAREIVRGFASALLAKLSGADALSPVFRDLGDTKNRITATTDASGNRTAVALDLS